MNIRNITPYGKALCIALPLALLTASCKNNNNANNMHRVNKIVNDYPKVKDSKYINTKLLASDYLYSKNKTDLKIENGISFKLDEIEYQAKDGEFTKTFIYDINGNMCTAPAKYISSGLPMEEALKMVAGYNTEEDSPDTLTLSKKDIKTAVRRLRSGDIWKDAKNALSYSWGFGKVRSVNNLNGIEADIVDRGTKLTEVSFSIDK